MRTWLASKRRVKTDDPAVLPSPTTQAIPTRALQPEHVAGARLYADREQLISTLAVAPEGVIAEIGVAQGNFSEVMLKHLRPKTFVAFDLFTMHETPVHWGIPSEVLFDGLTHREFYARRFADREAQVVMEVGLSHERLARYDDSTFDLIYIDAGHEYESVLRDAQLSVKKLKDDGILVFNDYIMYDHMMGVRYGIVPVVNEMVVDGGWHVVGFALQRDMFCDIAIQRIRSRG